MGVDALILLGRDDRPRRSWRRCSSRDPAGWSAACWSPVDLLGQPAHAERPREEPLLSPPDQGASAAPISAQYGEPRQPGDPEDGSAIATPTMTRRRRVGGSYSVNRTYE